MKDLKLKILKQTKDIVKTKLQKDFHVKRESISHFISDLE